MTVFNIQWNVVRNTFSELSLAFVVLFCFVCLLVGCEPRNSSSTILNGQVSEERPLPTDMSLTGKLRVTTLSTPSALTSATAILQISPTKNPSEPQGIAPMENLIFSNEPSVPILTASQCCGKMSKVRRLNYIVNARIWEGGDIIWIQEDGNGHRQVFQGRLDNKQLLQLSMEIVNSGFREFKELYENRSSADASEQCLQIELKTGSKRVCEYVSGAPTGFHKIYQLASSGAGAEGKPFIPERGYLVSYALQLPKNASPPIHSHWPTDKLGVSLDIAQSGIWIDGEMLDISWSIINDNWFGSIVQDDEKYYMLTLQVPDISLFEPPKP